MKLIAITLLIAVFCSNSSAEVIGLDNIDVTCKDEFYDPCYPRVPIIEASINASCEMGFYFLVNQTNESKEKATIPIRIYLAKSPLAFGDKYLLFDGEISLETTRVQNITNDTLESPHILRFSYVLGGIQQYPVGFWYLVVELLDSSGNIVTTKSSPFEILSPTEYEERLLNIMLRKSSEEQVAAAKIQANASLGQEEAAKNTSESTFWLMIVTLLLVIVTATLTLGPLVYKRFVKPKVVIQFENKAPYCKGNIEYKINTPELSLLKLYPTYWARLKVLNQVTGWWNKQEAKGVYVKLLEISDENKDKVLNDFDPIVLNWVAIKSETKDFKLGEWEYLDLFWTTSDDKNVPSLGGKIKNKYHLVPGVSEKIDRGINLHLPMGDYIFTLEIYGGNFDPIRFSLEVKASTKYNEVEVFLLTRL